MLLHALPQAREVLLDDGGLQIRNDLVEMDVLEKLESRGTKDMRILEDLHGIPVAALD